MGDKSWQPSHELPHGRKKTGHIAHSLDKTAERKGGRGGKMILRRVPMLIKTLILKKTLTKLKLSASMPSGPRKHGILAKVPPI